MIFLFFFRFFFVCEVTFVPNPLQLPFFFFFCKNNSHSEPEFLVLSNNGGGKGEWEEGGRVNQGENTNDQTKENGVVLYR